MFFIAQVNYIISCIIAATMSTIEKKWAAMYGSVIYHLAILPLAIDTLAAVQHADLKYGDVSQTYFVKPFF